MLLLLVACVASDPYIHDTPPEVTILSPARDAVLLRSSPVVVVARVQDAQEPPEDLALAWTSDTGVVDGEAVFAGATVTWTLFGALPDGPSTLTLTATDRAGQTGVDSVRVVLRDNTAPTVAFDEPWGEHLLGASVPVSVTVADADAPALQDLALTWGGAAASEPAAPQHPDPSGVAFFGLDDLPVGAHVVSVVVTDELGGVGTGEAAFTVISGDADGDGYVSQAHGGRDCDDDDPSVHPGAPERCNGVDDDCDGSIDEDATDPATWHRDADADGHGDPADAQLACTAPAGWTLAGDDCDDADPSVHPGAAEACNGVDDDCDGVVDEGVRPTWHRDADGDGHGDPANAREACAAPSGYVADATDCDDADPGVHPGAVERCNGVDDDCDGAIPASERDDHDADGAVACLDCDDDDPSVYPGAPERCNGVDDDCSGLADDGGVCPCPVRWYEDRPYQLCRDGADWPTARDACAAHGYHLVTITSAPEDAWVYATVNAFGFAYWWIGLALDPTNTWVWEDGTPVAYTHWEPGEPNNLLGNEACVELNRFPSGGWNDQPCHFEWSYVCEAG